MAKETYRLPIAHCILACLACFVFGLGLGLTLYKTNIQKTPNQQLVQNDNQEIGVETTIPIVSATPEDQATITLYFNNHKFNPESQDCSAVYPVVRKVTRSNAPIQATLDLLFAGPTAQEKSLGYDSVFSEKTKNMLKNITFKDGAVAIDFKKVGLLEAVKAGANSSCGGAQYQSSINKTLLNITGVKAVSTKDFSIEGDKSAYVNLMAQ